MSFCGSSSQASPSELETAACIMVDDGSGVADHNAANIAPARPPSNGEMNSTDSFDLPAGDEGSVMMDLRRGRQAVSPSQHAVNPEVGSVSGNGPLGVGGVSR